MNLRDIKKEIEYLVGSVIDDCDLYVSMFPQKREEANKIMDEAIDLYNDLLDRANNPDKTSAKTIKEHYRNVHKDLYEGVNSLCEKLSAVAGKPEEK